MKLYLGTLGLSFIFLSCSFQAINLNRTPAEEALKQDKYSCVQQFAEAQKQVVQILSGSKNFLSVEKNKKISYLQNNFKVECSSKLPNKLSFQVDQANRVIYFDSALSGTENLFETNLAKEHVQKLNIELRAITFDQLVLSNVAQALHDLANGKDESMDYYFQILKYKQIN